MHSDWSFGSMFLRNIHTYTELIKMLWRYCFGLVCHARFSRSLAPTLVTTWTANVKWWSDGHGQTWRHSASCKDIGLLKKMSQERCKELVVIFVHFRCLQTLLSITIRLYESALYSFLFYRSLFLSLVPLFFFLSLLPTSSISLILNFLLSHRTFSSFSIRFCVLPSLSSLLAFLHFFFHFSIDIFLTIFIRLLYLSSTISFFLYIFLTLFSLFSIFT